MLKTSVQIAKHPPHHRYKRYDWVSLVVLALTAGLGSTESTAEMIPAIESTGSTKLRSLIEDSESMFDRLLSWVEFDAVDLIPTTRGSHVPIDVADLKEEPVDRQLESLNVVKGIQVPGANSLDSSSISRSGPSPCAAILTSSLPCLNPVPLLYLRGVEFIHTPDAPYSGLFRPPRQPVLACSISCCELTRGVRPHEFRVHGEVTA